MAATQAVAKTFPLFKIYYDQIQTEKKCVDLRINYPSYGKVQSIGCGIRFRNSSSKQETLIKRVDSYKVQYPSCRWCRCSPSPPAFLCILLHAFCCILHLASRLIFCDGGVNAAPRGANVLPSPSPSPPLVVMILPIRTRCNIPRADGAGAPPLPRSSSNP